MRIEGLTEEQCNMLDIMWSKDSAKELYDWFEELPEHKLEMALTLHDILIQECYESELKKSNFKDAVSMLNKIGVYC
jgi:hypothetical protein